MDTYPFFSPMPRILAHRGDSQYYPENTLPAFLSAADLGVDVIETDVHLTVDNRVVIWHDDTLDRATDGEGPVETHTLQEIRALDAGYSFTPDKGGSYPFRNTGVRIMLLEEALEALPHMRFNIDLKGRNPVLVDTFATLVTQFHAEERILGASFHTHILRALRRKLPMMATSFSTREVMRLFLLHRLGITAGKRHLPGQVLQIPEYFGRLHVLTDRFIERFHRAGILIHVWTVNERSEMERILGMGVDAIFTDNPRLLAEVIAAGNQE